MNIGVIRERGAFDRRVALTPPVVRRLAGAGHIVWVETGAGDGAMFRDTEYIRAGAQIAYSPEEVIQRAELVAKIGRPTAQELALCRPGMALMAFYHMAVADRALVEALAERGADRHRLRDHPAGQRPPAGAGGDQRNRRADDHPHRRAPAALEFGRPRHPAGRHAGSAAGARGDAGRGRGGVGRRAHGRAPGRARHWRSTCDPRKLRRMMEHVRGVETCLADEDAIAEAVAAADVVIGAILVAGTRSPHVVTRAMVETMKPGSAIIDVSIDQGGCIETSRPTTLADPTFVYKGVTHFCVPNFTADLGRSSSVAIAQAMLPYLLEIARAGVDAAVASCSELARGVYTLRGRRP